MKKVLTVIISGIAIGLIAGLVMIGVNVFAVKTGIVNSNAVVSGIENLDKSISNNTINNSTVATKSNVKSSNNYRTYSTSYENIPELIEEVMPSVVSITNMQKFVQNGYSIRGFRIQPEQQEIEAPASGSGVIVGMTDEQVIILTNNHVVQQSNSLSVTFNDSKSFEAAIKGADSSKDLAIISVSKKDIDSEILNSIKIASIGNSDTIMVGEHIVAIGNALGIGQSVTYGIISAKDREIEEIGNTSKLIQTDAAINPGNSGGALINMRGELIGINVAKSAGNAIEGMGYAIPINVAKDVIETMSKRKDRESIPEEEQGQLGITARTVDAQISEVMDMPEGVLVYKINEDAPAAKSELKPKDIIVSFDDQPVKTIVELQELLRYTRAGQEVSLKVKRLTDGEYVDKEFTVKLAKKSIHNNQQENQQQNNQQNKQNQNNNNSNENQQQKQPNNGYYYDPFDIDDIFGNFPW